MSGLSAALAAFNHPNVAVCTVVDVQSNNEKPFSCDDIVTKSPQSTYSNLSDDSSIQLSSSSSSMLSVQNDARPYSVRPNEHLAVLMPQSLWKADRLAAICDTFSCKTIFNIFERRHHCRKCGGVFCRACSSRATLLLDVSRLSFLHPPRNVPITVYETAESPVVNARVCDDCWDQLHGCSSAPRTPELIRTQLPLSVDIPSSKLSLSPSSSHLSSPASTSPTTPPNGLGLVMLSERQLPTETSSLRVIGSRRSNTDLRRRVARGSSMAIPERSFGELDSYPLRRASELCKATGGGRWEPKQAPVSDGYRVPIPGGKAPYEIRLEQEREAERKRQENPVIKDGEFQYRFPRDPEVVLPRSLSLSTF